MKADGSDVRRLTEDEGDDTAPTWSPDGSRIAFASTRGGDSDIYVMAADGSGVTRLTSSPANDGEPAWSPEGNRILFTSSRDEDEEIYVMNADGSGITRLTYHPGVDAGPNWSPDGTRIVFGRHSGTGGFFPLPVPISAPECRPPRPLRSTPRRAGRACPPLQPLRLVGSWP
jgi:TolB protein